MEKRREKLKGSIFSKMMKAILLPLVILLLVVGLITLIFVQNSLNSAKATEVEKIAELGSSRVEVYFTKYEEMVRQMATELDLRQMLTALKKGQAVADAEGYAAINDYLVESAGNDTENISVTWLADFDASQFAESSGYTTEVGEWDVTTRVWYDQVRSARDVVVTEPYENSSTHSLVVSVIAPVWSLDDSEMIGVAGVDLNLDHLQETVNAMAFGETGAVMLVSADGMIVSSPQKDVIQKTASEVFGEEIAGKIAAREDGPVISTYGGTKYRGYLKSMEGTGWTTVIQLTDKEYVYDFYILKNTIFALFMVAIAGVAVGNVLVAKSIIKPITALAGVAEEIADGNLEVKMDLKATGETGLVANALQRTITRLKDYITYIEEINRVLNQIAQGDLTFELYQDYAGEFAKIKSALLNISTTLTDTVLNIEKSAGKVTAGSGAISNGAQSLSQGTMDQAASMEELQATVTDISERIDSNARNAVTASDKSDKLKGMVHECNSQMQNMVEAMREIQQTSDEISNVIGSIEKIANQTSMLSLNASIEAARAGEMGRGFAVVAGQVGDLAGSSIEASRTTAELISNALQAVEKGMTLTQQTDKLLQSVVESIDEVAGEIDNISRASTQQADAIGQITEGMEQISSVIEENSSMAQESSASAGELAEQAQVLQELIGVFKTKRD